MSKEDDIKAVNQDMAGGMINAHADLIREATYKLIDAIAVESVFSFMSASCDTNGTTLDADVFHEALFNFVEDWCDRDDCERAHLKSQPCDPMDRLVDGLTVRECLERYTAMQQEPVNYTRVVDGEVYKSPPPRFDPLTPAQKDAARLAWSAELKRKQQEAGETERRRVVVDDDRWEP